MNRAELLRLHALHKAAADALGARLKDAALDEYTEQGAAVTWRLEAGMVVTGIQNDAVTVVDREAFLDYLEEHTAAVQRVEVRTVPEGFETAFLDKAVAPVKDPAAEVLAPPMKKDRTPGAAFMVADAQDRIVPGLRYTVGGRVSSIAIRLDDAAKEASRKAAAQYAAGEISAEEYFASL